MTFFACYFYSKIKSYIPQFSDVYFFNQFKGNGDRQGNHVLYNNYILCLIDIFHFLWIKLNSIAERHHFRLRMLYQRSQCSGQYLHLSFTQKAFQAQADLCRNINEPLQIRLFFCVHLRVCFALLSFHSTTLLTIRRAFAETTKFHYVCDKKLCYCRGTCDVHVSTNCATAKHFSHWK